MVQPPPTPVAPGALGMKTEIRSSAKAGGRSQKEMLFMRGKAMSGAPIMIGTNQLPNPPIMAGMTMKKIMIRPWAVVKTLKNSGSPKICMPGSWSSARMATDKVPPMIPAMIAKIRYIVPMSLWFVE
jgi:hypothetical protein